MRERTAFTPAVIDALPELKLLITTGRRNASIDLEAAKDNGIVVCGTPAVGNATAAIATGLMLELARHIGYENMRLKSGALWQSTIGLDLEGLTRWRFSASATTSAHAWRRSAAPSKCTSSPGVKNLTPEKCREAGVEYVGGDELFQRADFLSIHLQLSPRTRGLIGARQIALMKRSSYLINTSRGPIVDEAALLAALRDKRIAGGRTRRV